MHKWFSLFYFLKETPTEDIVILQSESSEIKQQKRKIITLKYMI